MRSLTVLFILLLLPLAAAGQGGRGVVHGTVVAAGTGAPIPAVSVSVRAAADSSVVAGEITDAGGRFRVAGLEPGRYLVEATSLGYTSFSRAVAITAAEPAVDLGTIILEVEAIALEGISVEGERSQVVIAPDRTIYSTEDMPVAAGGAATDVLRSVPELEVDIDGAVSLRGTGAQIYLNGRPAPMEGEALQQFLQQFPADRIERVEVIPVPSARFEAEGSGGIVNIVLKENADLGLSGSFYANGSTRGDVGAGGRVAYQRGRWTLFGGTFFRVSQDSQTSHDLRTNLLAAPVTVLEQDAWSEESGLSGNMDLTAEYELSEQSTLWSEVGFRRNGDDSEALTEYELAVRDGSMLERYDRAETGESRRLSTDLSAGFRHVLDPQSHEFTTEIRYDAGDDDETNVIRKRPFPVEVEEDPLVEQRTNDIRDELESELSFEADYVRPWGEEGQVELGYEGQVEDSENDRRLEVFEDPFATQPSQVTRTGYAHREVFNSLYLILTRKMGPFGVQVGARAERADTRLEIPATGDVFEKDYQSLFPSANLSYEIGDAWRMRLSYSRRIRRPSPWVMNPINESSDPLNRRVGNPDIDPQYTHSFSFDASWVGQLGTLRLSPYYRRTVDDWAEIKTVDAAGVSTVTWENLASVETLGTSLTASVRPLEGWSGYVSFSAQQESRDASNLARDFSGSSFRWSTRGNVSARLTPTLSAQAMLFYTPPREVPQGTIGSRFMTHFGLRQELWGDRASIRLALTDPFDLSRSSFKTSDPTHIQTGSSSWRARSARLSFSWAFGRPPRDQREQEEEIQMQEQGIR